MLSCEVILRDVGAVHATSVADAQRLPVPLCTTATNVGSGAVDGAHWVTTSVIVQDRGLTLMGACDDGVIARAKPSLAAMNAVDPRGVHFGHLWWCGGAMHNDPLWGEVLGHSSIHSLGIVFRA